MAPLERTEVEELSAEISQELSNTRYACSSLTRLRGGSANFVFRGTLAQPLLDVLDADGAAATTVILKHSTGFLPVNREFLLDVSRCIFEVSMLNALQSFRPATSVVVKTPRLYLFNRETNTQIHEDFRETVGLLSILTSSTTVRSLATSIGHELGFWLRSFHSWASAPGQAALRTTIHQNEPMRRLKYRVTYDNFFGILENFRELLEGARETLERVREAAIKDFEKLPSMEDGEEWGLIHGDFWSGNVLLQDTQSPETREAGLPRLMVIDWELAQFGHRAYDLGQFIGDLYESKHFRHVEMAIAVLRGFAGGYGVISEDMAFRTAIHAGMHLIGGYNRGIAKGGTPQATEAMRLARDFILKGWERDRHWFEHSVFAPLFQHSETKLPGSETEL